jgi:ketosteroid isomerase-like protein
MSRSALASFRRSIADLRRTIDRQIGVNQDSVTTSFKPYRVMVAGDAAWAVNTNEYKGTFRDRPVDSVGVELMVLTKDAAGWRIRAIHWSSRARKPAQ